MLQQRSRLAGKQSTLDSGVVIQALLGKGIDDAAACACLRIACAKDDAGDARVHDRTRAHEAWLQRDIQIAAAEPVIPESSGGLAKTIHPGWA